jgi:uncharacterized membrane protein YgcG
MADLSGVPGAARIVEILNQLVSDAGGLSDAGTKWTAAGASATSMGDFVSSKASALDGAWDGAGADAVVGYATQLRTALDAVQPIATTVASALEQAEQALTAAHSAVLAVTDRVHAAVAALPPSKPDAPGEREQAVAHIVAPAVGEAETAFNTAVSTLRAATGQIDAACGTTPLHSLPPISDQPFEPARFTPNAWQIHPVPHTEAAAHTALHGAGTAPSGAAGAPPADSTGGGGAGGMSGGVGDASGGGSAGGGGGGGDMGGGPPAGGGQAAPAQVQQWIDEAIAILRAQGVPVDRMSRDDIWTIIEHESGGNPHAINNTDSNAAKGTPSKGLMQTIGPTFASNALPGHGDIWNPVDNIIAGVRYSISRYGSVSNVPGVAGMRSGGGYVGY